MSTFRSLESKSDFEGKALKMTIGGALSSWICADFLHPNALILFVLSQKKTFCLIQDVMLFVWHTQRFIILKNNY